MGALLLTQNNITDPETQRNYLLNKVKGDPRTMEIFQRMTAEEIDATYQFIRNHVEAGKRLLPSSFLGQRISAISTKYGIFT